ncbi:MAG: hypothetical protein QW331_00220 [Candidatus Woesearchaeota archaeon]
MADLFGKKLDAKKPPSFGGETDVQSEIAAINRRLKLIEGRVAEQDRKTEFIESNMLSKDRKQDDEIKMLDSELISIKKEIEKIKEKMMLIIKEIQLTAKAEDLEVIKRYLELWRPITFVTRKEVEKIVNDVLEERESPKIER